MKLLKLTIAAITVLAIAVACASGPKAGGPDDLDLTIREASDYLNESIPNGNKIAIIDIESPSQALSNYILDELISNAVNDRLFSVVDRQQLDAIRKEQNLQWSGEVDDKVALEVGRFLGAQTIVSGAVSQLGERYRLRIRALNVQTAEVQGQNNWNISAGKTITTLMASGGTSVASGSSAGGSSGGRASAAPASPASTAPAAGTYNFFPRLRALKHGMPTNVFIHKIVVHGRYMNIFFSDKAVGVGASGVPYFKNSHIQDLDNPRRTYTVSNENWQENGNYWAVTFEGVQTKRFTLIHTSENLVFEEIILGEPDS